MAIVVQYIDEEWNIQQRLIQLKLLQKSMTGEEIVQVVMDTLSREYDILPDHLLACKKDRASVNNVYSSALYKGLYTQILDIGCFSHTLDLVGNQICIPTLSDFMLSWLSLFRPSAKAKRLWSEQTGRPVRSYCPTRWWPRWECMKQSLDLFPAVDTFFQSNDEFSSATRSKLITLLTDRQKRALLKVELAVVEDQRKLLEIR